MMLVSFAGRSSSLSGPSSSVVLTTRRVHIEMMKCVSDRRRFINQQQNHIKHASIHTY